MMGSNDVLKYNLKLSSNKNMRFLKYRDYFLERDILSIAFAIFEVEKEIKKGHNIEKLILTIDDKTFKKINIDALKKELDELLKFVLIKKIEIEIQHKDLCKFKKRKKIKFKNVETLCFFSGGTDSFSGILNTLSLFKSVEGIFIAHGDQQKTINIVNNLGKTILAPNKINLRTINVPKIGKGGYSQLRGFLYFISASIFINLLNAKRMVITECGPTMYQNKFSPYDSITMTTHPFLLKKCKKIIKILTGKNVDLVIPFEDMTKAEVISISPYKKYLKDSHSCVSQLYRRPDGTCYGCVIRRLGMILLGVEDDTYKRNFITDSKANKDNLLSLIRFCYDVLFDYDNLNLFSKENIEAYNKKDLFERFSLDVFSSLYLCKKMKDETISQIPLLRNAIKKIGEKNIKKRIEEVRERKKKPNFNKIV